MQKLSSPKKQKTKNILRRPVPQAVFFVCQKCDYETCSKQNISQNRKNIDFGKYFCYTIIEVNPMKLIERTMYLDKLKNVIGTPDIKVITGVRRCGKSKLLEAFKTYLVNEVENANIIHINYNLSRFEDLKEYHALNEYIQDKYISGAENFVLIDEIQMCPDFELTINSLHASEQYDIYITGSNAFLLSSELGTLLSGRYIAINLHPFSFAEYVKVFGENASIDRLFRQYMNTSCFPEAVTLSLSSPDMVNAYLKALYETIVVKDIVKRHNLRKFDTLQHVVNFLFDSVGSIVSPNNIADVLRASGAERLSHNTVQKYIRFFTESYLIYPTRLYNIRGRRLLSSAYKYYVVDLGLRNILQTNNPAADLGHKLENVVYFELLRRGGEVYAGRADNGEVDFVVMKANGKREYYQVAYTANDEKTLERELSSLERIRDSSP